MNTSRPNYGEASGFIEVFSGDDEAIGAIGEEFLRGCSVAEWGKKGRKWFPRSWWVSRSKVEALGLSTLTAEEAAEARKEYVRGTLARRLDSAMPGQDRRHLREIGNG